jgi:hypothetical protein
MHRCAAKDMNDTALNSMKDFLRPGYRALKRAISAAKRPYTLRKIPELTSIDPARPVFVFFAPEAIIEPHYAAHAIIARTLKELGHQVLIVRCESDYPHCMPMEMNRLDTNKTKAQRREVCQRCDAVWLRTMSAYELPSIPISSLLDSDAKEDIHRLVTAMPSDAGKFEVDGFSFGALCGSDLALTRKVLKQMEVTGEKRHLLEAFVEGTLIAYRVTQKLMEHYSVARLLYFNEYSMLIGAGIAAMRNGVPITRLSHAVYRNIDRSKIMLAEEPLAIYTYHRLLDEWPKWRNLALAPALVNSIGDHSLQRLSGGGHTVYSPRHGANTDALFDTLNLSRSRSLLVAYPSSMDEYYSNMNLMNALGNVLFPTDQPFADQMSWLHALVDHVENSDDLQLVVRVHPREGRNVHEHLESDNLVLLKREFSGVYQHVRIVWPEENISSYDLAEIADLALTGWSNVGLELIRMGIPTLIAFKRYVAYPLNDVVDWVPTADAYFAKLRNLVNAPARLDQIRFAYRWTNVYSLSLSLDFSDVVPASDFASLPTFRMPKAAPMVEDILVDGASVTEINRLVLAAQQEENSELAETRALYQTLRKLIWFIATGEIRTDDYVLVSGLPQNQAEVGISLHRGVATLHTADRTIVRYSRIIERLTPLASVKSADASVQVSI